ncbi:PIN domain-containing protein [Planktothrix agardhii]
MRYFQFNIFPDPDDDMTLECAVVGGASYIVSGDRAFLSLKIAIRI